MASSFRSGNSRLLSKTLDQLAHPLAILDRRGTVVFANEPLCAMVQADATQLVGQQCSWQVAEDERPFAALMTALAPPAGARQGRIVTRQLNAPIVFGSTATGQIFVPLIHNGDVWATLVVLGAWHEISAQLPSEATLPAARKRELESIAMHIRAQWPSLDGLESLFGVSSAMQLALSRAQLAIERPCNVWLHGPLGGGQAELIRGIFQARLAAAKLPKISGQLFPIACELLEEELLDGMLDLFLQRCVRPGSPRAAKLLLLERIDKLPAGGWAGLERWLSQHGKECWIAATSEVSGAELSRNAAAAALVVAQCSTIEISIPPLSERREDVPVLANQYLAAVCHRRGRPPMVFSSDALRLLTAYNWPGNAEQLSEAIEEAVDHAVLVSAIAANHLPTAVRTFAGSSRSGDSVRVEPIDLDQVLLELERTILQRALKLSPRNRAQVARWLGISRPRLLRRIEQLGLDSPPPTETAD